MTHPDINLADLRQKLIKQFNLSELRNLAFDLGIDHEELSGSSKSDEARELIAHCQRRGSLPTLLAAVQQLRPPPTQPKPPSKPTQTSNPFFTGGRINNPAHFFGRQRLIREIQSELLNRANVSIIGESQIGKSALIYYLYATRDQWLPNATTIYLDLQKVLDEADFCEEILSRLGKTGDSLRQLKRALTDQNVILLLDEVERLAEPDFNPRLHDLLRALAQEPHFALCLVSQTPLLDLFPARTAGGVSPFHNIFTTHSLPHFTAAEAKALLQARLGPTPIQFTTAEMDGLIMNSQGHPARLQRAAKRLFTKKMQ